jgi:hypothetical protein
MRKYLGRRGKTNVNAYRLGVDLFQGVNALFVCQKIIFILNSIK